MRMWHKLFAVATSVRRINLHHLKHLFSHGVGLSNCGQGCIWTLLNRMFLVVVDAHTKWIEVFPMSNLTSFSTIQQFRTLFAQFGIPRTVVTDNGPCFISEEFREFMDKNGIHHIHSSPYHPASKELAERVVRGFKEGLKKMKEGTIR